MWLTVVRGVSKGQVAAVVVSGYGQFLRQLWQVLVESKLGQLLSVDGSEKDVEFSVEGEVVVGSFRVGECGVFGGCEVKVESEVEGGVEVESEWLELKLREGVKRERVWSFR